MVPVEGYRIKKEYLVFGLLAVVLVSIFTSETACYGDSGTGIMMGSGFGMGLGMGWFWIIGIVLLGTLFFTERASLRGDDAVDILDQKFARGEMSEEEYLRKRHILTTDI